jgi:hypothetical protein
VYEKNQNISVPAIDQDSLISMVEGILGMKIVLVSASSRFDCILTGSNPCDEEASSGFQNIPPVIRMWLVGSVSCAFSIRCGIKGLLDLIVLIHADKCGPV